MQQEQLKDIVKPHAHDVLSGRGNFVNHHGGNENFRKLVKHHKKAYVACPKAQKAIYSKIIYDEVRAMNPPGRFLKQDPKTKLWGDIGEKKALDKTRQALREGAPELLKELETTGTVAPNGNGNNSEDFVAPLRIPRNHLAESLLGNISLGSFSLGSFTTGASFTNGASFTTGGTGNTASFTSVPQQVIGGMDGMYGDQGTNSILAAAAQLQAQQQHQQQQQQMLNQQQNDNSNPAEWETQLNMLKQQMQMNSQQMNNATAQQQIAGGGNNAGGNNNSMNLGNGMGNNQSAGFNSMLAAAQTTNNSTNTSVGPDQMTALLAAIHNQASGLNNAPVGGAQPMGDFANAAYQQQLAQLVMLNSMNNMNSNGNESESTLMTGNLNNGVNQNNNVNLNNSINQNNGGTVSSNTHAFGSGTNVTSSFGSMASQQTQQIQNQLNQASQDPSQSQYSLEQQDQPAQLQSFQQGGYQEQSINISVPLKPSSDENMSAPGIADHSSPNQTRRPGNMRNQGAGLNSSFSRAQRIGLKNSFTSHGRRPNRRMNNAELHNSLKNSLMSIESLTLDDIDGTTMDGVFSEDNDSEVSGRKKGGSAQHGDGPHDMSEVSELEFEDKA